jgi:hypothetical protein
MKRIMSVFLALVLVTGFAIAQDLDQKVQIHGFATQGFMYSSANNYLSAKTSEGSPRWSDAAISFGSSLSDNLRIGVQVHFYQLGEFGGQNVGVDWASGDYKVNDKFGFRAGKVKTVYGLFNDSQDVDSVHLWSLLPEPFYAPDNKSFNLSHWGGDIYGTLNLGRKGGKISYTAFGGERSLDLNGGYVMQLTNAGIPFTTAPSGEVYGGDLRWRPAVKGLTVGTSISSTSLDGNSTAGGIHIKKSVAPVFYARYEKGRFFAGGEYKRFPYTGTLMYGSIPVPQNQDQRAWYAMVSYRVHPKLQLGTYYAHSEDRSGNTSSVGNYYKDWTVSSRYDFNQYFYAKAEGHFINGRGLGFYGSNPDPNTRLMALKVGFVF